MYVHVLRTCTSTYNPSCPTILLHLPPAPYHLVHLAGARSLSRSITRIAAIWARCHEKAASKSATRLISFQHIFLLLRKPCWSPAFSHIRTFTFSLFGLRVVLFISYFYIYFYFYFRVIFSVSPVSVGFWRSLFLPSCGVLLEF